MPLSRYQRGKFISHDIFHMLSNTPEERYINVNYKAGLPRMYI